MEARYALFLCILFLAVLSIMSHSVLAKNEDILLGRL